MNHRLNSFQNLEVSKNAKPTFEISQNNMNAITGILISRRFSWTTKTNSKISNVRDPKEKNHWKITLHFRKIGHRRVRWRKSATRKRVKRTRGRAKREPCSAKISERGTTSQGLEITSSQALIVPIRRHNLVGSPRKKDLHFPCTSLSRVAGQTEQRSSSAGHSYSLKEKKKINFVFFSSSCWWLLLFQITE